MPPFETMRDGSLVERSGLSFRPRLAAVGGLQDQLTAVQDGVVIERIDRHRRGPVAAVLRSRSAANRARPSTARSIAPCRCARPSASPCCRSRTRRRCSASVGSGIVKPDSQPPMFGCHARCRRSLRPRLPPAAAGGRAAPARASASRLSAASRLVPPGAAPRRDRHDPRRTAWRRHGAALRQASVGRLLRARRRPAHRPVVLAVAVDPVRHAVVHVHVIHLPVRQRHADRSLACVDVRRRRRR